MSSSTTTDGHYAYLEARPGACDVATENDEPDVPSQPLYWVDATNVDFELALTAPNDSGWRAGVTSASTNNERTLVPSARGPYRVGNTLPMHPQPT